MLHLLFSFIGLLLILTYNYISKTLCASFLHPTLITIGFSSLLVFVYRNRIIKEKDTTIFANTLKQRKNIMSLLGYKNSTYFFSLILATTDYFLLYFINQLIFGCSHVSVIIFIFIIYGILTAKYQNFHEITNISTHLFIYNLIGISLLSEKSLCREYFIIQHTDIYTYPMSGLFQTRAILIIILLIILFRKILLHKFDAQYKQKLSISATIGQIDAETFCCVLLKPCSFLNNGVYGICMIIYGICNLFGSEGVDIFLRQSFSLLLVEILYCGLVCASTWIILSYTYMSKGFYEFCLVAYLIRFFPSELDISIEDRKVTIKVPFHNFGSTFPLAQVYIFLWAALYIIHVFVVMVFMIGTGTDGKFDMGCVIDLFSKKRGLQLWQKMFAINQMDVSVSHMLILYFGISLILFIFSKFVSKFN